MGAFTGKKGLDRDLWLLNISMKFQMISHRKFSIKAHTAPETKLCKKVPSFWYISMGCANKALHLTLISLCFIRANELGRSAKIGV
jgi:hypothetical protein